MNLLTIIILLLFAPALALLFLFVAHLAWSVIVVCWAIVFAIFGNELAIRYLKSKL